MPSHKKFRFPPIKKGNETLTLRPLLIPRLQEPVQDGDGGINIQAATDDPEGLTCVINPYLSPMCEGDRLDIWWNNKKVLERFVTADEVDQRVFFYLPTPAESGWAENCHYVLTRVGETKADPPSASLRIMIKLYKPGNFDREPHKEDGHSELNIAQLPPELVEQGVIDAEWAKEGVLATIPHYVYCTRNDKVRLLIGDHRLPAHLITQEQAENRQPIEILSNRQTFSAPETVYDGKSNTTSMTKSGTGPTATPNAPTSISTPAAGAWNRRSSRKLSMASSLSGI